MAEEIDLRQFGLGTEDEANLAQTRALFSQFGLGSPEQRASELEDQKRMTRANILFDLAQAGLIIASTPPVRGESPAATLARAAAASEFFPKVGARSAELKKSQDALKAQQRQMDMAAVQRMLQQKEKREEQAFQLELAKAKKTARDPLIKTLYTITENGVQPRVFDINNPADLALFQAYAKEKNVFDEKTVTPYINSLTAESKLYRIVGDHKLGTGVSYKNNQLINLTDLMKNQLSAANITVIPSELKAEDITTLYKVTKDKDFQFSKPERIDISTILYDKDKEKLEADGWGLDSTPYDNALELEKQYQLKLIEKNLDPTTFVLTKELEDGEFDIQVIPTFGNFSQAMTKAEKLIADGYSYKDPRYEEWAALNLRAKELDVEIKKKGLPSQSFRLTADVTSEGTFFPAGTIMQLTDVQQNSEEFRGKIVSSEGAVEIIKFYKDGKPYKELINSPENRAEIEALLEDPEVTVNDAEFKAALEIETYTRKQDINLDNQVFLQKEQEELLRGRPVYKVIDNRMLRFDPVSKETLELAHYPADKGPNFYIITDTETGLVEFVDMNTPNGKKRVDLINKLNDEAGKELFSLDKIGTEQKITAKSFLVNNVGLRLSYDGGRTYLDENGQKQIMPPDAQPLSDTIAASVATNQRIRLQAQRQLRNFDNNMVENLFGGELTEKRPLNKEEKQVVRNAMEAARKGTGPYAGISAFLDGISGLIPLESVRGFFTETQANRQFLRALTILGRSALVLNPKFPVAELERVGALFPDPDKFWADPESEANKLIELKAMAQKQLNENNEKLAAGTILDDKVKQAVISNNYELNRLLSLLVGVNDASGGISSEAYQDLQLYTSQNTGN